MKNQVTLVITSQGWDVKIKLNGKTSVKRYRFVSEGGVKITGKPTINVPDDLKKALGGLKGIHSVIHSVRAYESVRRCRVCGCTDEDCSQCIEKTGEPCYWVEEDLCSACNDAIFNLTQNVKKIKS